MNLQTADAISRAGFSATDDEMERLRDQGGDDAFDLTTQLMSKAGSVLAMVIYKSLCNMHYAYTIYYSFLFSSRTEKRE